MVILLAGIRIVRPAQRGLLEPLGKYSSLASPGFHWIIPIVDRLFMVNVTEQMVDAEPQEIITNDNLNASGSGLAELECSDVTICRKMRRRKKNALL